MFSSKESCEDSNEIVEICSVAESDFRRDRFPTFSRLYIRTFDYYA